jgi:hypothetical protein
MEAPEKIYLVKDRDTNKPMDYWYSATTDDSRIEYTRTDAFIEKACEFISLNVADYIDVTHKGGIEHLVLQEKFIEDLKKYMEE